MLKATPREQTNQIAIRKLHRLYRMIGVVLVATVQNTVYAKMDQTFLMCARQADSVTARFRQTVIVIVTATATVIATAIVTATVIVTATIMQEIDITEIDTVEVHHPTTDVGAKGTTITETTLVTETDVTTTMTTITIMGEAVQGVTVERGVEIGDGIVDAIERRDLVGIDLEIDTRKAEIDPENDSEIDLDLDHVKDPGREPETGIETGVDLATDLEIEIGLVTEETGTAKIIDLVDAAAKVQITGESKMEKMEASVRRFRSRITDRMKEVKSRENVAAEVEAEKEAERVEGRSAVHGVGVGL